MGIVLGKSTQILWLFAAILLFLRRIGSRGGGILIGNDVVTIGNRRRWLDLVKPTSQDFGSIAFKYREWNAFLDDIKF